MDIDDEDDFYAPEEPQAQVQAAQAQQSPGDTTPATKKEANEELEEGEEEDEGGAMDEDEDSVRLKHTGEPNAHSVTNNPRTSTSSSPSQKTAPSPLLHRKLPLS